MDAPGRSRPYGRGSAQGRLGGLTLPIHPGSGRFPPVASPAGEAELFRGPWTERTRSRDDAEFPGPSLLRVFHSLFDRFNSLLGRLGNWNRKSLIYRTVDEYDSTFRGLKSMITRYFPWHQGIGAVGSGGANLVADGAGGGGEL